MKHLFPQDSPPPVQVLRARVGIQAGTGSASERRVQMPPPGVARRPRRPGAGRQEPGHPGRLPVSPRRELLWPEPRPSYGRTGVPTMSPLPTPRTELLLLGPLEAKGSHCRFRCSSLGRIDLAPRPRGGRLPHCPQDSAPKLHPGGRQLPTVIASEG